MMLVNVEEALSRFDGDREIYLDLLNTFLDMGVPDFPKLSSMLASGTADEVRKQVHKLKGGALTVGADALAVAAGAFESAFIAGASEKLAELLDEVASLGIASFHELETVRIEFQTPS